MELPRCRKRPGLQPSRQTAASIPRPLAWARQTAGPSARRPASDLCKTTRLETWGFSQRSLWNRLNERASMSTLARVPTGAEKIRVLLNAATSVIAFDTSSSWMTPVQVVRRRRGPAAIIPYRWRRPAPVPRAPPIRPPQDRTRWEEIGPDRARADPARGPPRLQP